MLKTDYTNDILDTSKNTERVYNLKNASGEIVEENIRIEDITEYSQEGSKFGANDINATNTEVNGLSANVGTLNASVSTLNTNVSTLTTKTNTLQTNVNNINLYVGSDKKLHFVNKDGADSALPFSKGGTENTSILLCKYGGWGDEAAPNFAKLDWTCPEDGYIWYSYGGWGSSVGRNTNCNGTQGVWHEINKGTVIAFTLNGIAHQTNGGGGATFVYLKGR